MIDEVKPVKRSKPGNAKHQAAFRERQAQKVCYLKELESVADCLRFEVQIAAEKGNTSAQKCESVSTLVTLQRLVSLGKRGKLFRPNVSSKRKAAKKKPA